MSRVTLERRLERVAAKVPRAPDPEPVSAEVDQWFLDVFGVRLGEIDYDAFDRAMAVFDVVSGTPLGHVELLRAAAGPLGDPNPDRFVRRRWYPPDPDDAAARAHKQWIRDWCAGPNRTFRAGADLTGYLTWMIGDLDDLTGTELERVPMLLAALDQIEREHPGSTANVPVAVFMACLGWGQGHCKWREGCAVG